jgi:hypothetical protein
MSHQGEDCARHSPSVEVQVSNQAGSRPARERECADSDGSWTSGSNRTGMGARALVANLAKFSVTYMACLGSAGSQMRASATDRVRCSPFCFLVKVRLGEAVPVVERRGLAPQRRSTTGAPSAEAPGARPPEPARAIAGGGSGARSRGGDEQHFVILTKCRSGLAKRGSGPR